MGTGETSLYHTQSMTQPLDLGPRGQENETIALEDVRYIIAEDDDYTRSAYKAWLERIGMNHLEGSFGSVQETLSRVKEMVERGERIDLLILDKDFFVDAAHTESDREAAFELLRQLEAYKDTLNGEERTLVDRIHTILFSGSVRSGDLETLRTISPTLIGIIEKPSKDFHLRIAGMLGNEGIVPENEHVLKGKQLLS